MEGSQNPQYQSQADIYKRIKLLGSGSYGRAYLVQEKLTGEEWVIKQINLADMLPEQQQTALKQAKILEMLNHTNIVRFREVYRTAKMKMNIVMEYAGGGDLFQHIKTAKETKMFFSEHQILNWFVQICLALRYIHSKKIIHRDLKAQNIFLTNEGLIKLGDFGVAKILEHTAARARTVVGSPYYISPQIIQNRPYSFKTDVWSLGAVLYELCALQPPFQANNLQFLALKIVQGAPPPLPKMYSQDLKWLIRSMLQTKQSNRPTIQQIFTSKIVVDTIKRLNKSHEINPRQINRTTTDFKKNSSLKPPPNLLNVQITENKSEIIQSKKFQYYQQIKSKSKAQTPQVNIRKGANNFFNQRPITGRKKVQPNSKDLNLDDLIQIKPSIIQKHEKVQRPQVPLPPVPPIKISPICKISSQQTKLQIVDKKNSQKKTVISAPTTAFTKKRTSFIQQEDKKKAQIKVQILHLGKSTTKKYSKIENRNPKGQIKPYIRKITYGVLKKQNTQFKLQICSQEAKKSQIAERKIQAIKQQKKMKKNEKKKEKKNIQKDQKKEKKEKGSSPMMQEQKCDVQQTCHNETDEYEYISNYYGEDFEQYFEDKESDDLTFSITGNESNLGNNFQKVILQLNKIQKIMEAGQNIEDSFAFDSQIPQFLNFSEDIRQDDNQFDSNHTTKNIALHSESQYIDLGCLETLEQLEVLRMKLEQVFGTQNLIAAYNIIEQKITRQSLNFVEEDLIYEIVEKKRQIDLNSLQKYFGHIAAIVSRQRLLL